MPVLKPLSKPPVVSVNPLGPEARKRVDNAVKNINGIISEESNTYGTTKCILFEPEGLKGPEESDAVEEFFLKQGYIIGEDEHKGTTYKILYWG
jgi:hypothetical protein